MAGDRDLAVAFVRAWSAGATGPRTGWEVTAATGVRGLRLLHEGGAFDRFLLTEAHPAAARVLATNAAAYPGAVAEQADGRSAPARAAFDYVDIDPYGSPAPFVDAALAAVRPGGVLAVTATDMMVLAGVQRGAAQRRYGGRPVRGRLAPEGGLRILLAYLAREARRRSLAVRPRLAYVRDHYVRAYLEVTPAAAARGADPIGEIDPATWTGPGLGERGPYGPMWLGPLFDPTLVRAMRPPAESADERGTSRFLERLREEVEVDRPFYYEANGLARELSVPAPPSLATVLGALRSAGYRAGRTHARPEGFRTDAPRVEVERIVRALAVGR
jgi:tRNA (guanine26-N2/guanine27-N2)-dimethyltransferase